MIHLALEAQCRAKGSETPSSNYLCHAVSVNRHVVDEDGVWHAPSNMSTNLRKQRVVQSDCVTRPAPQATTTTTTTTTATATTTTTTTTTSSW